MNTTALDFILEQGKITKKLTREEEYATCAKIYNLKVALYQAINTYGPEFIDTHFSEFRELEQGTKKKRKKNSNDIDPENRWRFLEEMALEYVQYAYRKSSQHKPESKKHKFLCAQVEHVYDLHAQWREAKDQFAARNIGLVVSLAKRGKIGIPLEERIQEGFMFGLYRAIDSYDHTRGFKFSTYAARWIKQAVSRATTEHKSTIRKPVHTYEELGKIARASQLLLAKKGKASPEQIAKMTKLDLERVIELQQLSEPVSLDKPMYSNEEGHVTLSHYLSHPHTPDPSATMNDEKRNKALYGALAALEPREQEILKRRFGFLRGDEETLREIGKIFRLSRERIRQVERVALKKLRKNMELKEFNGA